MLRKNILATILLSLAMSFASNSAYAEGPYYEVTIVNITGNILFTPILVASHRKGVKLFQPGEPASEELEKLAEGGNGDPLSMLLEADSRVIDVAEPSTPLMPGASVTVRVDATKGANYISLASMMLPTNAGFIALNGVKAPHGKGSVMYRSPGYDAGTEINDESCENIPGPQCFTINGEFMGEGFNVERPEKSYVHIHSGIHGVGDLASEKYAWHNPVATISIRHVGKE